MQIDAISTEEVNRERLGTAANTSMTEYHPVPQPMPLISDDKCDYDLPLLVPNSSKLLNKPFSSTKFSATSPKTRHPNHANSSLAL
jgi:hypothetical protein